MAREGDAVSLAAYVDAGVPVNLTNDAGDTLVMLAAYHGHAEAVRALVARGADVDRLNAAGSPTSPARCSRGRTSWCGPWSTVARTPSAGHPTAVDTARMFGREDLLGADTRDVVRPRRRGNITSGERGSR